MTMIKDIEITDPSRWPDKWLLPVIYVDNASLLYIREDYKHTINKQDPLSYMWISWAIGTHKYVHDFGINYESKLIFPNRRQDRFAFAFMFSFLKYDHKIASLATISQDPYLKTLMSDYPVIKYYYDNCHFILRWEPA